jgi:hypothetical protein
MERATARATSVASPVEAAPLEKEEVKEPVQVCKTFSHTTMVQQGLLLHCAERVMVDWVVSVSWA